MTPDTTVQSIHATKPDEGNTGHALTWNQGGNQSSQPLPIAPDLEFPNMEPPSTSTHLHGQFQCTRFNNIHRVLYLIHSMSLSYQIVGNGWMTTGLTRWNHIMGWIFVGYQDNGREHYLYPGDTGDKDILDGIAANTTLLANPHAQVAQQGGPSIKTTQSILPALNLPSPITTPNQSAHATTLVTSTNHGKHCPSNIQHTAHPSI